MAYGVFPGQGSNPCLLRWQADSSPLSHQEGPYFLLFTFLSSLHLLLLCCPVYFLPPLTCASSFLSFLSWLLRASSLGLVVPVDLGWVGWLPFSPFRAAFLLLQHHLVLVSLFIFKFLFTYYWSVIALQCFPSFCYTKTWISYMCIDVPSLFSLPPTLPLISLFRSQSTGLVFHW